MFHVLLRGEHPRQLFMTTKKITTSTFSAMIGFSEPGVIGIGTPKGLLVLRGEWDIWYGMCMVSHLRNRTGNGVSGLRISPFVLELPAPGLSISLYLYCYFWWLACNRYHGHSGGIQARDISRSWGLIVVGYDRK